MKLATLLVLGVAASLATVPPLPAQTPPQEPVAGEAVSPPEVSLPWLGVSTWPVSQARARELKLTEGFHLTVLEVSPGSPAAKAGLRANDVLLRFDDQILINPAQLRSLIRSRKSGEPVKVVFVRDGAEQTLRIPLGTKVFSTDATSRNSPTSVDIMEMLSRSSGLPDLEAHVRILSADEPEANGDAGLGSGYATVARSDDSGTMHLSRNESGANLRCVDAKGNVVYQGPINTPEERSKVPPDWLLKADQLGAGIKVVSQAPIRRRVILPNGTTPSLSLQNTDETGTVTLTVNQGSKTIRCVDPMGKTLFEGPINSSEERSQVPPEWLRRADRLNLPIHEHGSADTPRHRVNLSESNSLPRRVVEQSSVTTAVSVVQDSSPEGSFVLKQENGLRTLRATDAAGAVVFDGPIDTEEQRALLPEKLKTRLEQMEQRQSQGPMPVPPVEEGK